MNFISNIFGFFYNMFNYEPTIIDDDEPIIINEPSNIDEIIYVFINRANNNSSKLMLKKLKTDEYNNKYIKIYLLKSDTLVPLFKNKMIVNNYNLKLIKNKLSKKRLHLHTFIDAIDSFIEYNNIKNYHIFY